LTSLPGLVLAMSDLSPRTMVRVLR
jgi:hypothetical protein